MGKAKGTVRKGGGPPARRRRRYSTGAAAEKAAPCHSGAERGAEPAIHNHGGETLASRPSGTFIFVIMHSGLAGRCRRRGMTWKQWEADAGRGHRQDQGM